ncbi:MAG: outer membrane beta-barrel protein [Bacteriovoracaceae bacterium]|nr:outer membrane beta-barrel protein [Bacteriovoracaceae bacterium]
MKKLSTFVFLALLSTNAFAEGQVFYRYGGNSLNQSRGNQIFTDVKSNSNKVNDEKSGSTIGAGLDLKMMDCPMFPTNAVLGEIYLDYSKFSEKTVVNAADVLTSNADNLKTIAVSELAVVVAPKYRFGGLGNFRPWIIPIGLAFMVNSPPSNTTSYLDVGYHIATGAEYMLHEKLSLGADVRHTAGSGDPGLKMKYTSYAGYVGINF